MYQSEFCEIYYFKKENVILLQWKKFCKGEDYREPLRYTVKLLENKRNSNIIVDARNGFEDEKEDVIWVFEKLIPQMVKTDLRKILFITNVNNEIDDEISMFVNEFKKFFEVKNVTSLEDAFNEFSDDTNEPIVLNVTYVTKPGMRDTFLNKVNEYNIPNLSREVTGNMRYEYFLPHGNEDEIMLIEIWTNQAALDVHRETEHFRNLQGIKAEFVADVRYEKYSIAN